MSRWVSIGVACRASNVVGLDLDRKDGVDTLRALCAAARWPWPDTLTVATAHHGLHLYFRATTRRTARPASPLRRRRLLGPGHPPYRARNKYVAYPMKFC
ncbi:bifunctional DNA primase/polymerase [Salinispora arenicola]|uniref:bifunctional DNA primase/polymerase n=1 Tax=Salinispora arenicola TaxID=168697 RepID=UPI003467381F